jgi:hypothetical protein
MKRLLNFIATSLFIECRDAIPHAVPQFAESLQASAPIGKYMPVKPAAQHFFRLELSILLT